jgi:imidazoleglycerol-phosphate dehydratase/histidinol-phosphatase
MDPLRSAVIGDRETDLTLAANMGIRGIRLVAGSQWSAVADELIRAPRRGRAARRTRETEVVIAVDLDGSKEVAVKTGIGYFDHMLEQIARHGGFGLAVQVDGDLHVDEHHTVEDTALVLGEALRQALGDKVGIGRYGFTLPMDEAEARVAIDLSGRPYAVFKGVIPREQVGELPTELVPHFFRSLAETLGAALHIEVLGENAHHIVEAAFKGVGRALRPALALGGGSGVPSTKGTL